MIIPAIISSYLLLQVMLGNASKSWPSTNGKLEKYQLKKWTTSSKFPSLQGESEQCVVGVKYSYEVGGTVYKSRRINFGLDTYYLSSHGLYRTPEETENDELTKRLKNNDFLVYYSSVFPSFAVLIPGVINEKRHYAAVAILMIIGILLPLAYSVVSK